MRIQDIKIDDPVFVVDGGEAVGTVRRISAKHATIYVENAGEFDVPISGIKDVHFGKVILDVGALDPKLRSALGHSHDAEDPVLIEHTEVGSSDTV
jgi:hypothetical protein